MGFLVGEEKEEVVKARERIVKKSFFVRVGIEGHFIFGDSLVVVVVVGGG